VSKTLSSLVLPLALFSTAALAHHSPTAQFVLSERIAITGVVTEYRFVNPHALIFLDVVADDGSVEHWMAEGGNTSALRHLGWTGDEIDVGDEITLVGNPSRLGTKTLNWQTITVPGGRQLAGGNGSFIFPALQARWRQHTADARGR
jgi:Family of unknown function (DUF6152)